VGGPVNLEVFKPTPATLSCGADAAGSVSIRAKIYVGDHWLFGNRHGDVSEIEQHPPLRQDGNSIRIDYVNVRNISVDYEITVPESIPRSAATAAREIRPSKAHMAKSTCRTGSGDVKLSRAYGRDSHVQTGSGDVRALEIAGQCGEARAAETLKWKKLDRAISICIPAPATLRLAEFKGHSAPTAGSGDLSRPRVHRREPGKSAPDRATCTCACRRMPPSTPNISTSSGTIDVDAAHHHDRAGASTGVAQADRRQSARRRPVADLRTGSGDIHIE
jgi:hypothetical protein